MIARRILTRISTALLVAGATLGVHFDAPAAAAPVVTVSPVSAAPGTSVVVSGSGFGKKKSGTVSVAGTKLASLTTNRRGKFSVTKAVPSIAAGPTTVTATFGGVTASVPFTVLASTSTPTTSTATSALRAVGSPVLSDADAAAKVRRSSWEPRPSNATENATVPTSSQLSTFYSYTGQWGSCDNLRNKVTGKFTGTTDEIIQWAAWKWGLPEDVVRATAVTESWWDVDTVGDNGQSFGLMQIKNVTKWHGGTYPMSADATAFNVDYWAGMVRHYFEGCAGWMKDYSFNGTTYAAGDLWGSVGAWYAGNWHSDAANWYIDEVKKHLTNRTWAGSGF